MRQIVTRRFKLKAGYATVAILSEAHSVETLEDEKLVVVLARRDLVFLQALFAAIDKGERLPNYERLQRAVVQQLDSITQSRKPCEIPMPSRSKTSLPSSAGNGRKSKATTASGASANRKFKAHGMSNDST